MNLTFGTDEAFEEFTDWFSTDKKIAKKIVDLIKAIKRDPFSGIGKPEPLKHNLSKKWSRRITDEHRLVYEIIDENLVIISCKQHY